MKKLALSAFALLAICATAQATHRVAFRQNVIVARPYVAGFSAYGYAAPVVSDCQTQGYVAPVVAQPYVAPVVAQNYSQSFTQGYSAPLVSGFSANYGQAFVGHAVSQRAFLRQQVVVRPFRQNIVVRQPIVRPFRQNFVVRRPGLNLRLPGVRLNLFR